MIYKEIYEINGQDVAQTEFSAETWDDSPPYIRRSKVEIIAALALMLLRENAGADPHGDILNADLIEDAFDRLERGERLSIRARTEVDSYFYD